MRGFQASALAISTICRRDSGRSFTRARGWMSSAPARASAASAIARCARRSIRPKRRGGWEIAMLSATLRSGTSDSSWKMQAMPAALASAGEVKRTSRPSSSMRPSSGATTPAMILISVDLPAPFSPRIAWMRPASTTRCGLLQGAHAAIALGHAVHAEERSRRVCLNSVHDGPGLQSEEARHGSFRGAPAWQGEAACEVKQTYAARTMVHDTRIISLFRGRFCHLTLTLSPQAGRGDRRRCGRVSFSPRGEGGRQAG